MAGRFGSQNQQRQAQTQGVLFNRPNPRGLNGESVKLIGRDGKETDRNNYVFNQGKDITSLDDRSRFKYRVPSNSVVNKVGDCKMFLCCGWKLTAAQTLWLMHLLAFCCHTAMVFVTAWAAWWRKDMKTLYGDENPYLVTVMRLSAKWDNTTTQGYQITAEDNGMPIDLAWGCLCFFLLSAIAHLFSLTMGLFEATWFIFWRQLDDCFVYWRWIEYSGSASLMGMLLALTLGIREENTVRFSFTTCAEHSADPPPAAVLAPPVCSFAVSLSVHVDLGYEHRRWPSQRVVLASVDRSGREKLPVGSREIGIYRTTRLREGPPSPAHHSR
jgi:hypothetical protein